MFFYYFKVDAAAAGAAASLGASADGKSAGYIKDPIKIVQELIGINLKTQLDGIVKRTQLLKTIIREDTVLVNVKQWLLAKIGFNRKKETPITSVEW